MQKIVLFLLLMCTSLLSFSTPLPAQTAFVLSVKPLDPNTFILNWDIKPGYFLYKNRIKLTASSPHSMQLGQISLPTASKKTNRQGHTYAVYRETLTLPVSVLGKEPGETLLKLHYQGCSDAGFCYPPQVQEVQLTINEQLALISANLETPIPDSPQHNPPPLNKQPTQLEHLFSSHNWVLIIFSFFGFGLLLAFTPCVLPMIPVLSGIIVGHGNQISTRKAFLLSASYVLSMSVTYSVIGAVIALMGSNLQVIMQSPWAISVFALIFILLALSMFNVYTLRLPVAWQDKLARVTRTHEGGHYLSAALMGCMSILILSPCVTPPLIGVLSYVAQTGNILLGMLALFCLGLGMGTPLLLIGTSAGKLLPKTGAWMNAVKYAFGVLFLAVSIFLLSRILPAFITMCLWAILMIFTGIYLGALRKAHANRDKLRQGFGFIFLVYGLLILIGASLGHTNPLKPLTNTTPQQPSNSNKERVVTTLAKAKQALNQAKGHLVMFDFYADWCTSCKVIEATTLQDPEVQAILKPFIRIKVDLTANNSDTHALLNYFHVVAPPTFIFYDKNGRELVDLRRVGDVEKADFSNLSKKNKEIFYDLSKISGHKKIT